MEFTVYILFSEKFNKHYTGFSANLDIRLKSHNEFEKVWTAKFRPWKVIFSKTFDSKSDAIKYEKWLKSGIGRDFIKTMLI